MARLVLDPELEVLYRYRGTYLESRDYKMAVSCILNSRLDDLVWISCWNSNRKKLKNYSQSRIHKQDEVQALPGDGNQIIMVLAYYCKCAVSVLK